MATSSSMSACSDSQPHPALDLSHVEIEVPDYGLIREGRLQRNRETMQSADKSITKRILPEVDQSTAETKAAVCIQKTFRGFLGRKLYVEKLFAKYEEEEKLRMEKTSHQVEEGNLLIDNYHLSLSLKDGQTVRKNRDRLYLTKIVTIQRAWRDYARHKQHSPILSLDQTFTPSTIADQAEHTTTSTPTTTDISTSYSNKKPSEVVESALSGKSPGGGAGSLSSNPDHLLSDYEDENSETESAIAAHNMTLLTPEENQAGGDDSSTTTPAGDSEDDLLSSPVLERIPNPNHPDPILPPPVAVPGIKPVLNPQDILLSLERDKKSPSRFSVDAECESIVSDYSELGGPLRDIEREVHYLDRDTLRSEDTGFLELYPDLESSEKREEETEEDFDKRIRKINLLSLAQEFAELKKVDSHASAIDFHRNQSIRALRQSASPGNSRGQSVERTRRTPSKSPLRGASAAAGASYLGESSSGSSARMMNPLPKNYEKITTEEDLPVNEARRRGSANSDDLPANMRPDRRNSPGVTRSMKVGGGGSRDTSSGRRTGGQQVTSQGSSDAEGDFDVYNMESAVGQQVSWETLERHLKMAAEEEQKRLESCKNEREEIRRRLAMASEEDSTTDDSTETSTLLSPRNSRLQSRLQSTPSGMQICFMNDEILEDDDDDNNIITARLGDNEESSEEKESEPSVPLPNHPCFPGEVEEFTTRQTKLQSEATLALAQASTMARMQLEVERQNKKKSPIADMVGIPTLGGGRRVRLARSKLQEMNIGQLQVLVNDLHSQIELLNEDLVHLLIERDDLHMEQDSMLVDIEDLTSHCHDPKTTNNNKSVHNNNRPPNRRDRRK